jgi:hypothetical protein
MEKLDLKLNTGEQREVLLDIEAQVHEFYLFFFLHVKLIVAHQRFS